MQKKTFKNIKHKIAKNDEHMKKVNMRKTFGPAIST